MSRVRDRKAVRLVLITLTFSFGVLASSPPKISHSTALASHWEASPQSPSGAQDDRSNTGREQVDSSRPGLSESWEGPRPDAAREGNTPRPEERNGTHATATISCIPIQPQDPAPADCSTNLVEEDSGIPLTGRTPLILIHGIHGKDKSNPHDPKKAFGSFLSHFNAITGYRDFRAMYKVYLFEYDSDLFSVWELARSLRNWLDYEAKLNPDFHKEIVIVAHSMGGLVARSYMNEHDTDYDPPNSLNHYRWRRAGERVRLLITLGTPHHGSPLSDENPRVPNGNVGWNNVIGTLDYLYWAVEGGCTPCWTDPEHPNRSDLRWDNYDGLWDSASYNNRQERNDWLINIPHTYDSKIIAYAGYIGTNSDIAIFGSMGAFELSGVLASSQASGYLNSHRTLNAGAVILERIYIKSFYNNGISWVYNDGAVPIMSALFRRKSGANWPPLRKSTPCGGYDHAEMKDGKGAPCQGGLTLYQNLENDLGLN